MKSVETDDSIRKMLPQYSKDIGSLEPGLRKRAFQYAMWLVFYLDYFLLVNASLSITSAFIWFLPKFPGHFAPLLYLVGILSAPTPPSVPTLASIEKPLVSRLRWHSSGLNRRSFSTKENGLRLYITALLRHMSSWWEWHDASQPYDALFGCSKPWKKDTPKPKVTSRNRVYPQ